MTWTKMQPEVDLKYFASFLLGWGFTEIWCEYECEWLLFFSSRCLETPGIGSSPKVVLEKI